MWPIDTANRQRVDAEFWTSAPRQPRGLLPPYCPPTVVVRDAAATLRCNDCFGPFFNPRISGVRFVPRYRTGAAGRTSPISRDRWIGSGRSNKSHSWRHYALWGGPRSHLAAGRTLRDSLRPPGPPRHGGQTF